jgi:hypothetical protein
MGESLIILYKLLKIFWLAGVNNGPYPAHKNIQFLYFSAMSYTRVALPVRAIVAGAKHSLEIPSFNLIKSLRPVRLRPSPGIIP